MDVTTEKKYWSSLAQFNNDPAFAEKAQKEFLSSPLQNAGNATTGAPAAGDDTDSEWSRRDFMKLMAASTALASSACFQRPMHKILPYVNQPEEITFGNANFYASTCSECSTACGTLVKTREGRPIKIEGNPDHPMSKGGLCARGQASILNLYDPDRLRNPVMVTRGTLNTSALTWAETDKKLADKLNTIKASKGRVRLLTGAINSPSTLKLINDFLKNFANGTHVAFEPLSHETLAKGQELSYGARVVPRYRIDKADMIVSLDADFLGTYLSPVEFTKQWTSKRKVNKKNRTMSKLVVFESAMTVTGSNADLRVGIRPQDAARIALALANELTSAHGASLDHDTTESLKAFSAASVAAATGCDAAVIKQVANDLWANRGKSIVMAGSSQSQTENALSLHTAVNLLNSVLGNDGATIDATVSPSQQTAGSYEDLNKLIKEMNDGQVDALLIYKSNPAYTLPKELGFKDATKKVNLVISFNDRVDETAMYSDYVLPDNHPLESWGDAEPQKGLFSLIQPTIRPVYDTRSFQDSLIAFSKAGLPNEKLNKVQDFHEYLQTHWRETLFKEMGSTSFVMFWETALRDGVLDLVGKHGKRDSASTARVFKGASVKNNLPKQAAGDDFSLALYSQVALYDGRSANNPWLQELPDPVSRITWDNYASIAPKTAEKMGITDGDVVRLKLQDRTLELPAHVQPGLHEKVIAVAYGYGREAAGTVGSNVGQNMFALTKSTSDATIMSGFATTLKKTGAKYTLASVQEQHSLQGRPIVKEATLKEYQENEFAGNEEKEELTNIWSGHEYKGNRWAMAIDLNSCTGCGACVIGCQSENNIPTVGKDGVFRGRVMHWMRIDRYYSGTPDNPKVVYQPMLCQHCENAPCETVCPVIATAHDDEGLNQQIYNRCVGTRYCANNCPYKVRRFNWFDYNYGGQIPYPRQLAQNPEVTVRSRGVMEKCTFCVQRIHEGKNKAKDMGRAVNDGDIKTACQQSCPADAIVFGNINDSESEVTKNAKDPRGFHVLEELNVRPSITYLTKIRNAETV